MLYMIVYIMNSVLYVFRFFVILNIIFDIFDIISRKTIVDF